jgi:hypothetical protein
MPVVQRPAALGVPALREQTLPALLNRQAAAYGDKPLMRVGGLERSFTAARA